MLAARAMGSQGHQSLPFGYDPHGVHGIGLPSYIQPPGQPLLSEQENEQMQDFFSNFDGEGQPHAQQPMPGHFQENMGQLSHLQMPQQYLGHESHLRSPQSAMDWHQSMNFQFGNQMHSMSQMQTPTSPFTNGHVTSPVNPMFNMHQQGMHQFSNGWQNAYPSHSIPARPEMQFGSDTNFAQNHYAAPDGQADIDLSLINYAIEPMSSASNTQPNSRSGSNANSGPSSPVALKKRRLNAFQADALRMTSAAPSKTNGMPTKSTPPAPSARRKQSRTFMKREELPTPVSKVVPAPDEDEEPEEDAEYDEEDAEGEFDEAASPPAPWPSSKARPQHKPPPPPKPPKSRKKSTSVSSPAKPKMRRQSSSTTAIARVPLTAEQKKANHTNSEQRRRDATARAYAELYDLVPELEDVGKQSTMKKLELVVDKVRQVKDRLAYLRNALGRDPDTGRPIPVQIANNQFGGDMSHLSGWR